MSNALQEQSNRILEQQSTLEEISKMLTKAEEVSRMLTEAKEKKGRQHDTIPVRKIQDDEKNRIGREYESRFHQRKYDKSLSVDENVARSQAQSKERKKHTGVSTITENLPS
jgi:hypothetical protein